MSNSHLPKGKMASVTAPYEKELFNRNKFKNQLGFIDPAEGYHCTPPQINYCVRQQQLTDDADYTMPTYSVHLACLTDDKLHQHRETGMLINQKNLLCIFL